MDRKKVSELAKQVRGVSYKPEDLHDSLDDNSVILLRANNINGGRISFDDVVYVDKNKVSKEQYLRNGDILICASSGSKQLVGKAASVDFDTECTFGAFCKVVRPNPDIAAYLGVYFQSNDYRKKISEVAIGVNINNIRNEHIDSLVVSVGTDTENAEVVSIMVSVQRVIDGRKQELQKLDELVKARFVEMFGNPIVNDKHLPTMQGDCFFKLSNGKFVPEAKRFETGVPVYGGNGISWYTNETLVDADTLVVGRVGFQSGNVHYAKGPLWVSDNAMYISNYNEKAYDLLFLCHLMEHIDFTRHQDAGDLKKITQKPFMAMEYIHPSLQQQQEYTAFVKQVDKSKVVVQKALDEAQLLFDSLMQQYFG